MPETSRAATLLAPDKIEIREYPIPEVPADGGLVAVEMAGVCGSDVKYYHGKIRLPLPIILGHEILGRVVKLGRDAAAPIPPYQATLPDVETYVALAPVVVVGRKDLGRQDRWVALEAQSVVQDVVRTPDRRSGATGFHVRMWNMS